MQNFDDLCPTSKSLTCNRSKQFAHGMSALFCLLGIVMVILSSSIHAQNGPSPIPLRIQDLEKTNDPIASYIVEILNLAIKKSGRPYLVVKSKESPIPQARQIYEMSLNQGKLDVIWTMTSDEREQQIRAIKVPIDKGFFGWRIPFVHQDNPNLLEKVRTKEDLAKFRAGQGNLWPDTDILRSNGLPVITGSDESLGNMLRAKRFDYFPRPVIAIWNEKKNADYRQLAIDTNVILHYPTAFYFFVAPEKTQLAEDLTRGLKRAVDDGSFEKVFNRYFAQFIRDANIKNRIIFELKNPLIKEGSLPLQQSQYWFKP
ncbi:transporter substrate-binding domain-containing protein [Undibacterium fentianense]|uniref:Transporter substrate-binding domain-containing protein n=1 Tax=Undibacterium fentianense TaxID=2828728 RepID=A0A941IGN9_9BURK|nr:transporter substrate-binding domain-containing protein [Undibacterium fentianense]MBR7801542.1 transporter substrate-binding domain-containing protein [Undibacterium fentianense]